MAVSVPAKADWLEITVTPVASADAAKIATCSNEYENCYLSLYLGDQSNIDVIIRFRNGFVYFNFIQDGKYLATSTDGKAYLQIPVNKAPEKSTVTLFRPHPQADEKDESVLRVSSQIVARLEIDMKTVDL